MHLAFRTAFALAVLLVASPQAARSGLNSVTAAIIDVNNMSDSNESSTDQVGVSVDFTNPIFGDKYHAGAIANFGAVRANANYEVDAFSRSPSSGTTIEGAEADTRDWLTITGGTPGTAGQLHIIFTFEGSAVENVPGKVWGQYLFFANTPEQSFVVSRDLHGIVNGPVLRDPIDFTFGEPFLLTFGVLVSVRQTGDSGPPPFEPVFAMIDYGDTWTGSTVTDADGAPVPGFAITSESGTHYPISAPEPAPALLQLASAGLLAAWKVQSGTRSNRARRTFP